MRGLKWRARKGDWKGVQIKVEEAVGEKIIEILKLKEKEESHPERMKLRE